jgi:hypothetical protein
MTALLTKLAFCLLLSGLAYGQAASQPPTPASPMISEKAASNRIEPTPVTNMEDDEAADIVSDPASLLPDLPELHNANATLIGGTIEKLDRLRDEITLNAFGGGGRMKVRFDPRTHIYYGGHQATTADLHPGERIHMDTILEGNAVFASSIRISTAAAVGESQGIILSYAPAREELLVRDGISPTPMRIHLAPSTRLSLGTRSVSASSLSPGSLVAIKFSFQGDKQTAQDISILAVPGMRYTFAGQVTHLDLGTGLLVLSAMTDHRLYEIYLDPSLVPDSNLRAGAFVTVIATFVESRYLARALSVEPAGQ